MGELKTDLLLKFLLRMNHRQAFLFFLVLMTYAPSQASFQSNKRPNEALSGTSQETKPPIARYLYDDASKMIATLKKRYTNLRSHLEELQKLPHAQKDIETMTGAEQDELAVLKKFLNAVKAEPHKDGGHLLTFWDLFYMARFIDFERTLFHPSELYFPGLNTAITSHTFGRGPNITLKRAQIVMDVEMVYLFSPEYKHIDLSGVELKKVDRSLIVSNTRLRWYHKEGDSTNFAGIELNVGLLFISPIKHLLKYSVLKKSQIKRLGLTEKQLERLRVVLPRTDKLISGYCRESCLKIKKRVLGLIHEYFFKKITFSST